MRTKKQSLLNLLQSSQSGFTLMESLMAIVVLTIMLVGIAPMIVLSTAVRVQARRVEMATQAARSYIDGVRAEVIDDPNAIVELIENDDGEFEPLRFATFSNVDAPTGDALTTCNPSTTGYPYCPNPSSPSTGAVSLYCVDYDGDEDCSTGSPNDMIVQAYRSVTDTPTDPDEQQRILDQGYLLGIRVYRADAFDGSGDSLKRMRDNDGEGYRQRASSATIDRQAPLVEMTTEIIRSGTSYEDFCIRFGGCNQEGP